ncbi:FAD-dependent oxidoreductase [Maritalea sp. S77]|uniref:FAD-dependent oxidoreductase n=1 Tax=Maritalea sp. S77 TaxID=3415125 RepID=UPI003C7DE580
MITIAGAGVAGLCVALELARRGHPVTVFEQGESLELNQSSHLAGGMLAPWCEKVSAPEDVVRLGAGAADWWAKVTEVQRSGTLVVAPPRDQAELRQFASRTEQYEQLGDNRIADLEPDLAGRFSKALFFDQECHLDPRQARQELVLQIEKLGSEVRFGEPAPEQVDIDCRGGAVDLPELRMVRGEMVMLECPDVTITRTVRLLHPRIPIYLVPRGNGIYMLGATMVESASWRAISLRSALELLGAAFALHPGFGEASVIETGVGLRPAFPDNLPRIIKRDDKYHLNGFYRHGYLLAPAMAQQLADQFEQEQMKCAS